MEKIKGRPACVRQVHIEACAKINLYLKVLGIVPGGRYHEIRTLLYPVSLCDNITITVTGNGLDVKCISGGIPEGVSMPQREDNLVYKAALAFFREIREFPCVSVTVLKRIPISAGMGGGSSDAAFTLKGLNQLFGMELNSTSLYNIAREIGMDVPFFLDALPAVYEGRGDILLERYNHLDFFCVLVNPGSGLSTAEVYGLLGPCSAQDREGSNIFRFPLVSSVDDIAEYIHNDLDAPALKLCPEAGHIKDLLEDAGAVTAFLCGSGPTVCGLVRNKKDAEEVMRKVRETGSPKWWIKVARGL